MPLRHRDYRLLAIGSVVSMLGDGFFYLTIALQVYRITDNSAAALSAVGIAWTGSAALTYLIGGWAGDRFERQRIMIIADVVRGCALVVIGLLSNAGALRLSHLLALGAIVGIGNAFFNPSAAAIVPDLLPVEDLPAANAFFTFAEPVTRRFAGPAIAGLTVSSLGMGVAFLVDGATFFFSAAMLALLRVSPPALDPGGQRASPLTQITKGLAFVRSQPWCWAFMVGIALNVVAVIAPAEVLLPLVLSVDLGLDEGETARYLGLILAGGGLGSIAVSLIVGQRRGLPRRYVTIMYGAGAAGSLVLGIYGVMSSPWHGVAAALVGYGLFAITVIYWQTMLQTRVPRELLGRVSSLDYMLSLGLMPIGFAAAGALVTVAQPKTILGMGAVATAVAIFGLFWVPGVRDIEPPSAEPPPSESDPPVSAVGSTGALDG